ncbi:MAG: transglutaminase family protein [Cyanobacteriota bacterium]|nr:transglutaminase family protein [Cyanobacteriota bacterium]
MQPSFGNEPSSLIYQIQHLTRYRYVQPVQLAPHTLRLHPRSGAEQTLQSFHLNLTPQPDHCSTCLDLDGNVLTQVSFGQPLERLEILAMSQVVTHRSNPFDFLLHPWAARLPIDYPIFLWQQLQPYCSSGDPSVTALGQDLLIEAQADTVSFLALLNQRIYQECRYLTREVGDPWPAGYTWQQKAGSCRDLALLWMMVCRSVGLATRFVSGYAVTSTPDPDAIPHLHAWGEVYLPGAGWRGFDPTQGLAVADGHIALCASPYPAYAAPVTGYLRGEGSRHTLEYSLSIQALPSAQINLASTL